MIDMHKMDFSIDFKNEKTETTFMVSGYASVFGNKDSHGDIVMPGAFAEAIKDYNEHYAKYRPLPLLKNHNQDKQIGKITMLREDAKGLYMEAEMPIDHAVVRDDVMPLVKAGALTGFSIGYKPLRTRRTSKGKELTRIKLGEVSIVNRPSNLETRISANSMKDELDIHRAIVVSALAVMSTALRQFNA